LDFEAVLLPAAMAAAAVVIKLLPSLFGPQLADFWARISRWLLATVGVSVLPILIDYLGVLAKGTGDYPTLVTVIEHGELCLITTALASVAAGELVGLSQSAKVSKVILSGLCSLSVIAGISMYVIIKLVATPQMQPLISGWSAYLLVETIVVSTAAIAVAELRK
jgi:hypothetical protein